MAESDDYIVTGRKTFFIAPDIALLPESYMEDFMLRGYETYIIREDRLCNLEFKIEILISLFPDLILFFYIDTPIKEIEWPYMIKRLQERFGDKICIGVLYSRRKMDNERIKLEQYYLFECGVQGGCIALEFQKERNFPRLEAVLAANQACGRRKHIRAICDGSSKIVFTFNEQKYSGMLLDVSDSHFSCTIHQDNFNAKLYEKIPDILLELNGLYIRSDATLCLERAGGNEIIYVFVFNRKNGTNGLENDVEVRLVKKIYSIISTKINNLLTSLFLEASQRFRKRFVITAEDASSLIKDFMIREELGNITA